jgi:hypothetical protein
LLRHETIDTDGNGTLPLGRQLGLR